MESLMISYPACTKRIRVIPQGKNEVSTAYGINDDTH